MIEAVLFDIGNVLLRFDYRRAVKALTEHTDMAVDELTAVMDSLHPQHETGQFTSFEYFETICRLTGFRNTETVFHQAFCDIFTPNEPMWEFVRGLFGRTPVYLFSNISSRHEAWIFEQYPELHRFDGGFYSWRLGCMKPDPDYYRQALATLPFKPENIAYFDDLPGNIAQGLEFGLKAIQYDPDAHPAFLQALADSGLEFAPFRN